LLSIVAFKTLDISQGSVATQLRCGGIFSDSIIKNFLLIQWNNFENRLKMKLRRNTKKLCHFGPPSPCIWKNPYPAGLVDVVLRRPKAHAVFRIHNSSASVLVVQQLAVNPRRPLQMRPAFIRDPAFIRTLASSSRRLLRYNTGYTVC